MSRYTSLCKAIDLALAVGHMMSETGYSSEHLEEMIADLRDVAKDVRYGGRWEGDFETMAQALDCCVYVGCAGCSYKGLRDQGDCRGQLKKDAAAAIRYLGKEAREEREKNRKLMDELNIARIKLEKAQMYTSAQEWQEAMESAKWEIENMKAEELASGEMFPWEDQPTEGTEK